MNTIVEVLDILKGYKYLGENQLEDGTLLIGRAPHIASQAWLHSIYPALSHEQIEEIEDKIGSRMPEDYKHFLQVSNGLNVFNTTFNLYGKRANYNRNVDAAWQPFDIIKPNTIEKPDNAKPTFFVFAGYDWDGSHLYLDTETNKIHLCERDDATSLFQWNNFAEMLSSEINRLKGLFDKQGRQLKEDESTLPI